MAMVQKLIDDFLSDVPIRRPMTAGSSDEDKVKKYESKVFAPIAAIIQPGRRQEQPRSCIHANTEWEALSFWTAWGWVRL
jgi:hypothetical protein